jgi:hypothetical protein
MAILALEGIYSPSLTAEHTWEHSWQPMHLSFLNFSLFIHSYLSAPQTIAKQDISNKWSRRSFAQWQATKSLSLP